ncbi:2-keto-4-pentenoate hydratase [Sporichthya polymorpha]|uniref:2-keto-4-pentenoate hydratase n=1 Tax=Sporichthya polymorpha TaxID=35751 RepID=UPI000685CBDE|nr:fumarylacetoacetate hydrolase family protein [Sporichthya polymorpha]
MTSSSVTPQSVSLREIADELDRAARTGVPTGPPSAHHDGFDVDAAYEVQRINIGRAVSRGDVRVGHKIGLTSLAMQQQLGVDSPDFGVLLASMNVPNGSTAAQPLLQPRIEAEIAFLLGADLDSADLGVEDVLAATDAVMPALEIIDSRIADWKITLPDTVADNASSGAYVLGTAVPLPADLREVELVLTRGDEEVGRGLGSAALGHPAECVAWLARTLRARGDVLRAGSVILSGAVHASVPAIGGQTFTATSAVLGSVSVTFPARTEGQS